jgi:hypothetical protein
MTQIILYQAQQGVVLATDSRAVRFDERGTPSYFAVQKLFRLTPSTLLATAGAGYGLRLCLQFQQRVQQMRLIQVDDVMEVAVAFFQNQVALAQSGFPSSHPTAEMERLYIVLAGYGSVQPPSPLRFLVLAAEHATDPLHILTTTHFVCIPRRINIEYRLNQLAVDEVTCEEVESLCMKYLLQLVSNTDEVAPPFHFARITTGNVHLWSSTMGALE